MVEHNPNQGSEAELTHGKTKLSRGQEITSEERVLLGNDRMAEKNNSAQIKENLFAAGFSSDETQNAVTRHFDVLTGFLESHRTHNFMPKDQILFKPIERILGVLKRPSQTVFAKKEIRADLDKYYKTEDAFINDLNKYTDELARTLKDARTSETDILMGDWPKVEEK